MLPPKPQSQLSKKMKMNTRTNSTFDKKRQKKSKYANLLDFVEERESILKDRISYINEE